MRVVCVSDAIVDRNGVGTYYRDLMDHLGDHVERAELISPRAGSRNGSYTLTVSLPGDPTQRLYFPKVRQQWKKVRRLAPDVVIVTTPGPYGWLGFGFARWAGGRLCTGCHTRYEKLTDLYWSSLPHRLGRIYLRWINRLFFTASDMVVAISEDTYREARRDGARTIRMLGTPVAKQFLNETFGDFPEQLSTLCYCGRLSLEKNIHAILRAAENMPQIRFKIAGDGPLRAEVAKAASQMGNLTYLGWVSRAGVRQVIDESDLLLLPSRVESFGTAALEAMARARPPVVSAQCGILNWPELAQGAYVIGAEKRLEEVIAGIAADTAAGRRQKAARARRAAQKFTARTIRQWLAVLSSLASAKRPQRRAGRVCGSRFG